MSKATGATVTPVSEQTPIISNDLPPELAGKTVAFFEDSGNSESFPQDYHRKDFFSDVICQTLKADLVQHGRVSCHFSALPALTNYYNGIHGGAVAAIAERVAIACARTVVTEDKEMFLGELAISYLSAATQNEELVVGASIVRSGRNLSVVAIEFKIKKTGKLVYTSRATFYHLPMANL